MLNWYFLYYQHVILAELLLFWKVFLILILSCWYVSSSPCKNLAQCFKQEFVPFYGHCFNSKIKILISVVTLLSINFLFISDFFSLWAVLSLVGFTWCSNELLLNATSQQERLQKLKEHFKNLLGNSS